MVKRPPAPAPPPPPSRQRRLGSCARSKSARRLKVAGYSQVGDWATGRPATDSGVQASRLRSLRYTFLAMQAELAFPFDHLWLPLQPPAPPPPPPPSTSTATTTPPSSGLLQAALTTSLEAVAPHPAVPQPMEVADDSFDATAVPSSDDDFELEPRRPSSTLAAGSARKKEVRAEEEEALQATIALPTMTILI